MGIRVEQTVENLETRAIALWTDLEPAGSVPEAIETLKSPRRKSAVLRLFGAGPQGESVVAKRAARASIELEARVYRDVLAKLSVSTTRLLGMAPDGDRSWLFLEDAGDAPFEAEDRAHRRLAAVWMARVHGGARLLRGASDLPLRGPDHYVDLRRSVEALMAETLLNPSLAAGGRTVIEGVAETCDALGVSWPGVVAAFAEAPSTITFGGFSGKNARVRTTAAGPLLMPFDFESAGYGCPAIDLVFLDGDSYVREARGWWSGLDDARFAWLRGVGRILGGLKAIPGERSALLGSSPSKAVAKLEWYRREVIDGMSAAGLKRGEARVSGGGSGSEG